MNAISISPIVRGLNQAGCPEVVGQIAIIATLRYAILATRPDVLVTHIDLTNRKDFVVRMEETGRTEWYCRVIKEGYIEAGAPLELLERPYSQWTVLRAGESAFIWKHCSPGPDRVVGLV